MRGRTRRCAWAHRMFFESLNCGIQIIRSAICHRPIISCNASSLPLILMSFSSAGIRNCDSCLKIFIVFSLSALPPSLALSPLLWKISPQNDKNSGDGSLNHFCWHIQFGDIGLLILFFRDTSCTLEYWILWHSCGKATKQKQKCGYFFLLTSSIAIFCKISLIDNTLWETSP